MDVQFEMMPALPVKNGPAAIEFYKKAFGAIELLSNISPDGEAVAELSINGTRFVVADEAPGYDNPSPERLRGTPVSIGMKGTNSDIVDQQAI